MAALPLLAPRPTGYQPIDDKLMPKEHNEREWEAMRDIIKKLYIYDNRKLNETMAIVLARHGFAATEQMYKKRLKKWNFRKRAYRRHHSVSAASAASTASTPSQPASTPRDSLESQHSPAGSPPEGEGKKQEQEQEQEQQQQMCLVRPSNTGPHANLEQVLSSVFSWTQCKLDSGRVDSDPMSKYLAHPNHPPIQDSRTMYRTFELVFDLWSHGKGDLAGMAARRGFYVLEFVLTDDHPDLIWHVMDTIFDMADRGHLQLLSMFLKHATILAQRQLPAQHPLLRVLTQLEQCDYQSAEGRRYVCHLLHQAWLRNVDLLAEHIGASAPQRLWLYEQLIWDGRTPLRKGSELSKQRDAMYSALEGLAESHKDDVGDDESDRLRIDALLLEFTQMDLGDREKAEQLARNLLERTESSTAPLSSARFHAYARKMLARILEDRQDWPTAEENMRLAITKREAAHGTNNNLRVIRDMWVLAAHFQKAGRMEDAEKITADALVRAQKYLTLDDES